MLGGRVKTLHPAVHGGILAQLGKQSDITDLDAQGIAPISIVVCNLYPFEETIGRDPAPSIAQAVEEIDIGGVTLLRAAAKNHERVSILSDPRDYVSFLQNFDSQDSQAQRNVLALKVSIGCVRVLYNQPANTPPPLQAFTHTAKYDAAISDYFRKQYASAALPSSGLTQQLPLRYGANPHQKPAQAFVTEGDMPVKGELMQDWCLC